nr:HAD family hydrolase [Paenibacillus caui]
MFDKDGTLLDFVHLWGEWASNVTKLLEHHLALAGGKLLSDRSKVLGIKLDSDGSVVDYDHQGPLAMATEEETTAVLAWQLYAAGIPWNEAMQQVRQMLKTAMQKVREQRGARPMPGLLQLLERCAQLEIPLAVVTADRTSEARLHLEWMGIHPFFTSIVGNDRVRRGKPDPEMVLLACSELGIRPEEAIVIGDSNGDMQMGRQAGTALTIGYAPDGCSSHLLDADEVIRSFNELIPQG